ncbi:hypothetical protein ACFX13_028139 [Malus domestica]
MSLKTLGILRNRLFLIQQQVALAVEQLLAVNSYNPDILPNLENYVNGQVSSQTYNLDANLCLLSLYQVI